MSSDENTLSTLIRAVDDCPENARVFIGGLGLGVILFPLAFSHKAREVIICEKDSRVIDVVAPLVKNWFEKRYPNLHLTIMQEDATTEVSKHGNFDWIFMDIDIDGLRDFCVPYLTERGTYTCWLNPEIRRVTDRILYFRPVEVNIHPQGLRAEFIYSNWVLAHDEILIIDPDTATLNNPTEDGCIKYESGPTYTRDNTASFINFGGSGARGWMYDYRGYIEWPISSLFGGTLTANPKFKVGLYQDFGTSEEVNPISSQPSTATDADLYADIASGTAYVDPWNLLGGYQEYDLGASAKTDLQDAIDASRSWFAIGLQNPGDEGEVDAVKISTIYSEEYTDSIPPVLIVEYSVPAVGNALFFGTNF